LKQSRLSVVRRAAAPEDIGDRGDQGLDRHGLTAERRGEPALDPPPAPHFPQNEVTPVAIDLDELRRQRGKRG
jgi:hypothetical protein